MTAASFEGVWSDPSVAAHFNGVAVVTVDGERVHSHIESDGPELTVDSSFWVGSIAKQFAAVAVLKLVEDGALSLSDPVSKHLEELRGALTKDGVTCTVEHLLNSACGLPREVAGFNDTFGHLQHADRAALLLERVAARGVVYTPNSEHLYSNLGYALAGLLVARVSGEPYEAFLRRRVFATAGLERSGIDPAGADIVPGQFDLFGRWFDSATWLALDGDSPSLFGAGGNVHSTASDLITWAEAMLGGSVLPSNLAAELVRVRHDGYALGIAVSKEPYGEMIWHNGALTPHGYSAFVGWVPTSSTAAVVICNRTRMLCDATRIGRALIDRAHDAELEHPLIELSGARRFASAAPGLFMSLGTITFGLAVLVMGFRGPKKDRVSWAAALISAATIAMVLSTNLRAPEPTTTIVGAMAVTSGALLVFGVRRRREQPLTAGLITAFNVVVWLGVAVSLCVDASVRVKLAAVALTLFGVAAVFLWRPQSR